MSRLSRDSSPPRNFDILQQKYNDEASQNWQEDQQKKKLYYHIVQLEKANLDQRRRMEKQLKEKEDSKILDFWKADRQRYFEDQRRKKKQIDDVRHTNQMMSMQVMNASKIKEDYLPHSDSNTFYEEQYIKNRRNQQEFFRNAEEYKQIRQEIDKHEKQLKVEVQHQKQKEQFEIYKKRQEDLKRIRQKHQQDFAAYHNLDEHIKNKQKKQEALEQMIVNKGEEDQQARIMARRLQFEQQQKKRKGDYIRDLKQQLDNSEQKSYMDHQNNIEAERNMIAEKNRYYSEMDRFNRMRKSEDNKNMLEILKNQVKPRRLLPETDIVEKVGLGSPVNIGKVIGTDRRRQLDWIEKSLLREIHY